MKVSEITEKNSDNRFLPNAQLQILIVLKGLWAATIKRKDVRRQQNKAQAVWDRVRRQRPDHA